jgi:Fe-S cluster assembly protein SufD
MSIQVAPVEAVADATPSSPAQLRQAFLTEVLAKRPQSGSAALQNLRDRAQAILQEQGLPTLQDEDWRFTDLAPLYSLSGQLTSAEAMVLTREAIAPFLWPDLPIQLVFVNGVFAPELSTGDALPTGLTFETLKTFDLTANAAQAVGQASGAGDSFTALNSLYFQDVAALRVAHNQAIASPVHLLWVTTTANQANFVCPRLWVCLESGAQLQLVEEFVTCESTATVTVTNAVAECWLGPNADLHHTRIQREGAAAIHLGKTSVTQAQDSRYRGLSLNLGGQLARHTPEVTLTGIQTETILNGLAVATGTQLSDTHSAIAFTQPHGTARQLHKCIIDDRARGVFNGKVFVPQAAQQTDAAQLSRNLLLSPKARVDTKPQLEIVADDVKCAHGATVSQLDDDSVFYLQSRGLDQASACDLLVKAFAAEIIDQCPTESLRSGLLMQVLAVLR